MKKHLTITVHGDLKNSGFRFSAVDKALDLELTGKVKNYNEKSLDIVVEGEMESLQKFLKWCHVGPDRANIEKVDFESSENLENFENFSAEWFE